MVTDFIDSEAPRRGDDTSQPEQVPVCADGRAPDCRTAAPAKRELSVVDLAALAPTEGDLARPAYNRKGRPVIRRPKPAEPIYLSGQSQSLMLIKGRVPGDFWVVTPSLFAETRHLAVPVDLHLAVTAAADPILLPVVLRRGCGGLDRANATLGELVPSLVGRWATLRFVRTADAGEKGCSYVVEYLKRDFPKPTLPDSAIEQLILQALSKRTIVDPEHPVLGLAQKRPN